MDSELIFHHITISQLSVMRKTIFYFLLGALLIFSLPTTSSAQNVYIGLHSGFDLDMFGGRPGYKSSYSVPLIAEAAVGLRYLQVGGVFEYYTFLPTKHENLGNVTDGFRNETIEDRALGFMARISTASNGQSEVGIIGKAGMLRHRAIKKVYDRDTNDLLETFEFEPGWKYFASAGAVIPVPGIFCIFAEYRMEYGKYKLNDSLGDELESFALLSHGPHVGISIQLDFQKD